MFRQGFIYKRRKLIQYSLMYNQRFAGVTYSKPCCLRIYNNFHRHLKVCIFIYIDMTISGSCVNSGNCSIFHYKFNQSCSSPRNYKVYIIICSNQLFYPIMSFILYVGYGVFIYSVFCKCLFNSLNYSLTGIYCI